MADREKVIKGLEWILNDIEENGHGQVSYYADEIRGAVELLKEQPEIVRCGNCKHGEKPPTFRYYPEITWCNKHSTSHNDDWFCTDGERRCAE